MADLNYTDVVDKLSQYYGTSGDSIWGIINDYNLTPAQAADLLPQYAQAIYYGDSGAGQIADGVYQLRNNAGDVISYTQVSSVPMGESTALVPAINSNTQTGTAEYAVKTQFAGNSVIDQNGKIKTEAGVAEYKNGVKQQNNALAVVAQARAALSGWSVGMTLGKAINSELYKADPVLFSAWNPENWDTITADLGDTGLQGVAKKAINYLLKINPDGSTQAYMSEEAFNQIAYALAQKGLFDEGQKTATHPTPTGWTTQEMNIFNYTPQPLSLYGAVSYEYYDDDYNPHLYKQKHIVTITSGTPVYAVFLEGTSSYGVAFLSTGVFTLTDTYQRILVSSGAVTSQGTYNYTSGGTGTYHGANYQKWTTDIIKRRLITSAQPSQTYGGSGILSQLELWVIASIIFTGTITDQSALPGVSNQENATVPDISSQDTKQQVIDKVHGALPDLRDNRLEQDVVQDDGTVTKIIYYPVPMPSDTVDTVIDDEKEIEISDPVEIILPEDEDLELPDGTVVHGDGVTVIEIPPGEYTLPANTTITNNYIYNTTNITGGSQQESAVTDNSLEDMLKLVIAMLTSPQPQSSGSEAEQEPPTETDNPPDTGEGETPPLVIPVGSASALWSVYNPSLSEINSFGGWLWSNNFIDQLLKLFNDPMQAIIGLHKTYIAPVTGSRQNIRVGYLDSGVSSLTVPTQYSTVDCGTVSLEEYFGNVFDYSPYTRVYIYLPFVGFKELDVSQVMRSRIGVRYHGDAFTGTGLAEVSVTRDGTSGGVLYSYGCECAVRYPLSQGSYLGIIGSVAGLGMAGLGIATANPGMALGGLSKFAHSGARIEQSGGFSGNSGAMGIKKPYLVVMRPQTAMPRNYQHYSGVPSSSLVTIGSASGLIRVRECHVESIVAATKDEKDMIEKALYDGIIVS